MKDFIIEAPSVLVADLNGVYKLVFNNGRFYFGSTKDLRKRIASYEQKLVSGKASRNIMDVVLESTSVKIEIISICPTREDAYLVEDRYIKLFFGNPLLINRCPSAYSTKGIKRTDAERKKQKESITPEMRERMRQRMLEREMESPHRKRVAKLDLLGNLIEIYPSITHAALAVNSERSNMGRYLRGLGIKWKGFLFRFIDDNGNIIERPKKLIVGKRGRKKGCNNAHSKGTITIGMQNGSSKKKFENRMDNIMRLQGQ